MHRRYANTLPLLLALAPLLGAGPEKASLSGRAGNYTEYFLGDDAYRHNRYELDLTEKASFSYTLAAVAEGRFRYDAALGDDPEGPRHAYAPSVKRDELWESEARQMYLDFLSDSFRLKAGLMLIDWVDTLSPLVNDALTPIDLRFGGFGEASEVIVPMTGIDLNHPFFGGSLEWLVVPVPVHSRLPQGDNGYGLFPLLEQRLEGSPYAIAQEDPPQDAKNVEGGARYQGKAGGLEWTLLGYHGHQRTPAVGVETVNEGQLFRLHLTYPEENTYGTSLTYARGGAVVRALCYYEPNRRPPTYGVEPPPPTTPAEQRTRGGLGFDYVHSRHLKLYTEQFATRTVDTPEPRDGKNPRLDYTAAWRLTNETFKDATFTLDAIGTLPHKGTIVAPAADFSVPWDMKLTVGARIIHASDLDSPYYILAKASHVYVSLFKHFSAGG
jgi:hypothetical protein